ncbi:uncharacterized protein LOC136764042 [Amia ocellicauda]|uniref:uncharacterized protein LOC136764042 n=1 Tax=Amia ocellicauda TaxID=2972642 RepID=UPI003463BBF5
MSKIQLTLPVKATIITGMCQGLTYLHQKRIVHQDLKPDNIMIEYGSNRPVLIDFGVAKILYAGGISTAPNIGNEAYAPPKVLRGSLRGKHSDVWAMGKIVAELLLEIRLEIERYRTWDLSKQLEGSPYLEPLTKMLNDNYHLRASMDAVVGSLVKAGESLSLEQKPKPTQEKAPRASAFVGPSERFMGITPIQRSNFPHIRPILFNSPAHRWGDLGISGGLRQLQIREPSLLPGNGSPFLGRDSLFDRGPSRLLNMPQGAFVQESHQFYRYEDVSSRGEGGGSGHERPDGKVPGGSSQVRDERPLCKMVTGLTWSLLKPRIVTD